MSDNCTNCEQWKKLAATLELHYNPTQKRNLLRSLKIIHTVLKATPAVKIVIPEESSEEKPKAKPKAKKKRKAPSPPEVCEGHHWLTPPVPCQESKNLAITRFRGQRYLCKECRADAIVARKADKKKKKTSD